MKKLDSEWSKRVNKLNKEELERELEELTNNYPTEATYKEDKIEIVKLRLWSSN